MKKTIQICPDDERLYHFEGSPQSDIFYSEKEEVCYVRHPYHQGGGIVLGYESLTAIFVLSMKYVNRLLETMEENERRKFVTIAADTLVSFSVN